MRRLGQLETAVMAHLWAADTWVSVREVVEDLRSGRTIAYTTVLTVLDNLHAKGFVDRIKDGRAFRYSARASREAHTVALMEEALADTPTGRPPSCTSSSTFRRGPGPSAGGP